MGTADFGTGKSLVVLAIVAGCFAILWPKIFYPMMQTAFAITSPKTDSGSDDPSFKDSDRPPHIHPGSINPRLRGAMPDTNFQDKLNMREGRPFPHPQSRQPAKAQPKSGGAMSIIMPVYTVGIMVFFLYTVLKLVFKKQPENDKKPLIKDFHMDPEYRKFVCQQQPVKENVKATKEEKSTVRKRKTNAKNETPEKKPAENKNTEEFDEKDYEIYQLRKKLEETEQAMQRIMKHMGAMSACLSDKLTPDEDTPSNDCNNDQPPENTASKPDCCSGGNHKTSKRNKKAQRNAKTNGEPVSHESCKRLQEDLAKLIKMSNLPKQCLAPRSDVKPNVESSNDVAPKNDESESDENASYEDGIETDRFDDRDQCTETEPCCNGTTCAPENE